MLNEGTLIGAVMKTNDDQDNYPVSIAEDNKGGYQCVATVDDMNAIKSSLLTWGMLCFVQATQSTYELQSDLVTWLLVGSSGGGTVAPGSGGSSSNTTLISGNFGNWTALGSLTSEITASIPLQFKSDLQAFATRAITYLEGQFSINSDFAGTSLVLGVLPANSCPSAKIIKYMIVENIEMYLWIDTDGTVSLNSKDGDNLPVSNDDTPYYIDTFFQPVITSSDPETFTYTRTESFTPVCPSGESSPTVSYSQTYTSSVSTDAAEALAMADPDYEAAGQAYANANGTCTVTEGAPTYSLVAENNSPNASMLGIYITGPENYSIPGIAVGGAAINQNISSYTYTSVQVGIRNPDATPQTVTVNGVTQSTSALTDNLIFDNVTAPINIVMT